MAESDLQRFLHKVQQLNAMVSSLEREPGRRADLAACHDHNQVVKLARSWGYEIGRRWGESPEMTATRPGNLLAEPLPASGEESVRDLQSGPGWRMQLIQSCAAASAEGFWYEQEEHEWLVLLRGSARLALERPAELLDLSVGDALYLAPHRRHRVERTDPDPGTLWLVLFWRDRVAESVGSPPA